MFQTYTMCGMKKIITAFFFLVLAAPVFVSAAPVQPRFYYAGWIPFWKKTPGIQDITNHLQSQLNEISPFSYEVRASGALVDKLKIDEGFWPGWLSAVHDMHTKILPTVAWFDSAGIHRMLSDTARRRAHEDAIAALAQHPTFDGVDIDYENKRADTRAYFSLFIKGLATRLHAKKKILSCTVEPRTPLTSLFREPHARVERANDYAVLNTYCDEVRVMAYDQGSVDFKLSDAKASTTPYMPVADPEWVKKVMTETMTTISRKKIMLGIPTYGYEYALTTTSTTTVPQRLRSLTWRQAMDRAALMGATPQRNSAGELSYTYTATSSPPDISAHRLVSFSDASAIADKIALAKKMKLRGIVLFKLDGEADPALWDKIK